MRDDDLPAPVHEFRATGDPRPFADLGRRFLGPEVAAVPAGASPPPSPAHIVDVLR